MPAFEKSVPAMRQFIIFVQPRRGKTMRTFLTFITGLILVTLVAAPAQAISLADLSNKDASGGLKEALTQGAGKAAKFGLVKEEDARMENYVTQKALDGLYLMIAEEEKSIRQNPAQAAGKLARKVFDVLK
jgi:hypothetical protein